MDCRCKGVSSVFVKMRPVFQIVPLILCNDNPYSFILNKDYHSGTPKDIIAKLNAEGQKAVKSPEFVKRMTDLGYEIVGGTPEQMASMIQDEYKRWGPIVIASGAKVD